MFDKALDAWRLGDEARSARYRERVVRELDPPSRPHAVELAQRWLKVFLARGNGRGH